MGQVGQPEHVLDRVDGQPDVGAVFAIGGSRKQLNEIDRTSDELAVVGGVDVGGPICVGAGEHQCAERRGKVDNGAEVDGRRLQPVLVEPFCLVFLERVAAVHLVVAGDDDVVEVKVDRDAGSAGIGHRACAPWIVSVAMPAVETAVNFFESNHPVIVRHRRRRHQGGEVQSPRVFSERRSTDARNPGVDQ